MEKEKVRIFIHGGCEPCHEIKRLFESGKVNLRDAQLLDLATKEGSSWLDKVNLARVPSAFQGTKSCRLILSKERDFLTIDCPKDEGNI